MIINLPETFPLEKVSSFDFGNVEAANDPLLAEPLGFCDIAAVRAALRRDKSIIVGRRGSGKTALFRLIRDGHLKVDSLGAKDVVVVGIQEPLDYKVLGSYVDSKVSATIDDDALKYRVVWEIFIIHRALAGLRDSDTGLSSELDALLSQLMQAFEVGNAGFTLSDWINSHSIEVGAAIETEGPTPVPKPYVKLSPASERAHVNEKPAIFNLAHARAVLNSYLAKEKRTLVLLVDRLDEFVASEDYVAQRLALQGLLECERSYQTLDRIILKLFLREDLFTQLDFSMVGPDKVSERVVDLRWSPTEIRKFIAQRLTRNILKATGLPHLRIAVDGQSVVVDDASARIDFPETEADQDAFDAFLSLFRRKKHPGGPHRVGFNDEINRQIVLVLFPPEIRRIHLGGIPRDFHLFGFFEEALREGENSVTPRTVLRFLRRCFDGVGEFYGDNPNIKEVKAREGVYGLVPPDVVSNAYEQLKRDAWEDVLRSVDDRLRGWTRILASDARRVRRLSEIQRLLRTADEDEVVRFIAFLQHFGVLHETAGAAVGDPAYSVATLYASSVTLSVRPQM